MDTNDKVSAIEEKIVEVLKTVYDPEIPVNIWDLGLIYKVDIDEEKNVEIEMTLTAPNCPMAEGMFLEVREKVGEIKEINKATVKLTFEPPWYPDLMSEEAKLELGFL